MDFKKFKHKLKIKVRFSDLDAMKHVNNAAYLSYLEESRIAYFNHVTGMIRDILDFGAVVARIEIDYLSPIVLGEDVEILTRVSKLGNKSSDVEDVILVERNGEKVVAATALTKLVSYDYRKSVSIPIPEETRKKIIEFEGF